MPSAKSVGAILSALTLLTATVALPLVPTSHFTLKPVVAEAKTAAQQLADLQAQQKAKEAEAKRQAAIKAQADTKIKELSGQISSVSENIQQTQSDIVDTSSSISQKDQQVAELTSELTRLESQQGVLLRQMYIMRASMPDSLLLFSDQPVSDREKEQAQFAALKKSVAALYLKTTAAKQDIELARNDLVARNERLANLKDQQTAQKEGLASYQETQAQLKSNAEAALKDIQAQLLKIYQGEANAQKAIDDAVAAGLRGQGVGPGVGSRVNRGAFVGIEDTTGFSTGCHVHEETRVNNVPVNPQPYINNGTIDWALSSGFTITQPFGHTSFSYVYKNGIHPGIDIAKPCGAPVYAPADGTVIVNSCPDGCGSGYGHLWAEQMDNGMVVMLGHLRK
jgi:murein DD-endopeptidase MepM/ murein hydrolase activator NlpD